VKDNRIWFGPNGNSVPAIKRFLSEVKQGVVSKTIWFRTEVGDNQEAKKETLSFNNDEVFATPKPERLIYRALTLATNPGDWVLLDVWGKLQKPGAVYYDITWVGYVGAQAPPRHQEIFSVVRAARDAAVDFVAKAVARGETIRGYQVDDMARGVIRERGYGDYFVHRTGHSIGEDIHSTGANMDNLETHDERELIPGICFSIEPGIYLPEFGVRSEVNVYVGERSAGTTGAVQQEIVCLLP